MSHFTHIKTRFQNLRYLEKALNRLNINYQKAPKVEQTSTSNHLTLRIPQRNGYDIEFAWNGKEYEMVMDISFWEQALPVESFMDNVTQHYAGEVILGEGQKMGFQLHESTPHFDGSKTLVLERWNTNHNTL